MSKRLDPHWRLGISAPRLTRHGRWLGLAVAGCLAAQIAPAQANFFGDYDGGWSFQPPAAAPERPPARKPHKPKHLPLGDKGDKKPNELAAKAKGVLQIVISIREQRLRLYADGTEVAESRVSTGMAGHSTPMGLFNVIEKQRWHRSNIYSGAPMPFMQRITWSGVALHLGVVPNYPASHGCIRMPNAFARELWGTTKLGARVIIAREPLTPVVFENPHLFALTRPPQKAPAPSAAEPDALQSAPKPSDPGDIATLRGRVGEAPRPEAIHVAAVGASEDGVIGRRSQMVGDNQGKTAEQPLKPGPISVFVSRKEGKLFVRKGFEPVFSVPVTIARVDEPLGTHLFTAMALNDDGTTFRWNLVTVPNAPAERRAAPAKPRHHANGKALEPAPAASPAPSAAEAIDRITIPDSALARISELMSAGASFIISDAGLGSETGQYTDFIVLTH